MTSVEKTSQRCGSGGATAFAGLACDGRHGVRAAARIRHVVHQRLEVQPPSNWHQTGTNVLEKTKKSAGANRLTFVFLGSPTWARTRDLRINRLLPSLTWLQQIQGPQRPAGAEFVHAVSPCLE